MILQALHNYYSRLYEHDKVPEFGFSLENVGFALEIDLEGNLVQEHDLRQGEGKNLHPGLMEIPFTNEVNVRSNNVQPNFLVDKAAYLLGNDEKTKKERLKKCHEQFKELLVQVGNDSSDEGMVAIQSFYKKWIPEKAPEILEYWQDIVGGSSGFIVFRLLGERDYIHNHKEVRKAWIGYLKNHGKEVFGHCLLTGENKIIQHVHSQFKGIKRGQSSGKSLVSFNIKSAESYGKEQSYNAPVSIEAEFRSATSLKYLIRSDANRIYIGDIFTVFWTERDSPIESIFGLTLDPRDVAPGDNKELAIFLESVRQGKLPHEYDPDIRFFVLGLSPSAARLSVRFWHVSTVKEISQRLGQHFKDLSMVRSFDSDPEYPGISKLLWETVNKKSKKPVPPPLLGGAIMQSILNGTPYPQALLSAVIGRIRADQNINYIRAAIIKAVLERKKRIFNQGMEVPMALDKENKNVAYLLGRLFAVLERIQEDAHRDASGKPRINSTILDKYYSSASTTPVVVFSQLLRLKIYHIRKIDNIGLVVNHEKLVGEIIDKLKGDSNFPKHLTTDQQGMFAIGYYHQRQDFFEKKENKSINKVKEQ